MSLNDEILAKELISSVEKTNTLIKQLTQMGIKCKLSLNSTDSYQSLRIHRLDKTICLYSENNDK